MPIPIRAKRAQNRPILFLSVFYRFSSSFLFYFSITFVANSVTNMLHKNLFDMW